MCGFAASQVALTSRVYYSLDTTTGDVVSLTKVGTLNGDVLNVTAEVRIVHKDNDTKTAFSKVNNYAKNLLTTVADSLP
jgi:hypothetical protein